MRDQEFIDLREAYTSIVSKTISESHFKVGDEVSCKASGMVGKVVKVDPEEEGKYYTVKRKDGKTMKYSPAELKKEEQDKEEMKEDIQGLVKAGLEKGSKFMKKNPVGKIIGTVIKPVGSGRGTVTKAEQQRKVNSNVGSGKVDESRAMSHTGGTPHPLQGDGSRPRGMGGKNFGIEDLPPPAKRKTVKGVKEETGLFDYLLEYLVAEGYADTNKAALVIMANMSEEWRQSIVEMGENIGKEPKTVGGRERPGVPGETYAERQKRMKPVKGA
jgi:hypothetical protein